MSSGSSIIVEFIGSIFLDLMDLCEVCNLQADIESLNTLYCLNRLMA